MSGSQRKELDFMKSTDAQEQAEALYIRALTLYDQQQYGECLALLGQALPLERDNAHIYYSRGNVRYALGDYRGAAAEYLWALRRAPYYVSAYNNLGNVYEALSQYEKSLAKYQHALHIEPDNATLYYNLAGVYHTLGRLPDALDALNTAIELEPEFGGSYLNRANVLSRLGRHREALADYQQALLLEPEDSNTAWTVAWSNFGKVAPTSAEVVQLERISLLDPKHYTSYCCLAVIALYHSDSQAALTHLSEALRLESDQWDPHFWCGIAAALQGEPEIAWQAIEKAVDMGLPPLLLTPLYWLQSSCPDFFEKYARGLLQRFGI
jgi:tetratricopeptide (TPR) repeat protein